MARMILALLFLACLLWVVTAGRDLPWAVLCAAIVGGILAALSKPKPRVTDHDAH